MSTSFSSPSHPVEVSTAKVLRLALPALGVLAAAPLYLLLDTAVVGRLGATDLAALGAATTIQAQVTTQLTFLSYGTTARSAQHHGAGRHDDAVGEGVQASWLALGVGLLLMTLIITAAPTLTRWLAGDATVAGEATQWLRVAACGIPLILLTMAGNGWLRGIQNTRLPLIFTLLGVGPSAALVPVLVGRYGIVGSAWANLIGETITSLCFIGALVAMHRGSWMPQRKVMVAQLQLGKNLIARSLLFQVSFVSAAAVAGRFGASSLAAHQVMLQLWSFLTLVLDSLAIAAQALIGAIVGGTRAGTATGDQARRAGSKIVRISVLLAVGLCVILACGYQAIPRIFTQDATVLATMAPLWWLLVGMVAMGGVVFAFDGVLMGASDMKFLRNATALSALVGFLPAIWLSLLCDWSLTGVWCGLALFIFLRMIAVVWRFKSMAWLGTSAGT
ncbi:MATE family efflux transporter [Corynebacterium epidermidicanis]|uniref:Putative efflux protein, MATE family n=1 Tax=Corynebacterium epidermidicanis TaxID=1050174 RepID=A0A0G3GQ83_9CORY|nr:MATE family efflux transporter [Corynebacterium epidermidicanis]AKK03371.1 putative efflux protein, MATE family [Corynebacterium epidermidicanis]